MRLEVSNNLEIAIYRDGEDVPFFWQPYWPNTAPWASLEVATEWGQAYLNWLLDSAVYPQPPLAPENWAEFKGL
jgi:hypothetical protein